MRLMSRVSILAFTITAIAACGDSHDGETAAASPSDVTHPAPSGETTPAASEDPRATDGRSERAWFPALGLKDDAPSKPTPTPGAPEPDLYDPDEIPHFELGFDAQAMAVLSSVAPEDKETWVHASFKVGSIKFADVGVRRKGSSTFRALPQKASFKIKLNKYVKGQKVYGLTDLTLNNQVSSGNFISERVAYHVFRSLGLPAPRANSARVSINGEDYGLYLNVETPDEKFLDRVLGAKANTLYEANPQSTWSPGAEWNFEADVEDPTAPAGTKPDLTALFQAVAAANDATLVADISPRLHTTEWLRFSASEAMVSHWDGYAYSAGSSKNYFLAGDTDGKFALVPWSTDLTFPLEQRVDASVPNSMTLLARCKLSTTCWSAYKTEAKWLVDEFEKLDLEPLAKKWHNQIDALVKADPKRETSLLWYQQRTDGLYEFIRTRPAIVRGQLGI
jgi:hypothetical protein